MVRLQVRPKPHSNVAQNATLEWGTLGSGCFGRLFTYLLSFLVYSFFVYLLSSLASAMWAWFPASDTAVTNALPLAGVDALPERMLRNIMCLP